MELAYRKGQENLIPVTQRSPEERLELSRRGGIRSGEVRREKRNARDLAALVLDSRPKMPPVIKTQIAEMNLPVEKKHVDARLIAMCAMMRKAMAGDQKSLEFMLKLTGEMPDNNGMFPGDDDEQREDEFDEQHIRQTLDSMSDEQLKSYQELCGMFSTGKEAEE